MKAYRLDCDVLLSGALKRPLHALEKREIAWLQQLPGFDAVVLECEVLLCGARVGVIYCAFKPRS